MGEGRRLAWARVVAAVAVTPRRWAEASRTVVDLAGRQGPGRLVVLPDRGWLAFRMETAYGDARAVPSPDDVLELLAWQSAARRFAARSSGRAR